MRHWKRSKLKSNGKNNSIVTTMPTPGKTPITIPVSVAIARIPMLISDNVSIYFLVSIPVKVSDILGFTPMFAVMCHTFGFTW